jgi:hypothetical protein
MQVIVLSPGSSPKLHELVVPWCAVPSQPSRQWFLFCHHPSASDTLRIIAEAYITSRATFAMLNAGSTFCHLIGRLRALFVLPASGLHRLRYTDGTGTLDRCEENEPVLQPNASQPLKGWVRCNEITGGLGDVHAWCRNSSAAYQHYMHSIKAIYGAGD